MHYAFVFYNVVMCILIFNDVTDSRRNFLLAFGILLIIVSVIHLLVALITIGSIGVKKTFILSWRFARFRVLIEGSLGLLIPSFVTQYLVTKDWCAEEYQWNFGAICTFLSWLTVLTSLTGFPYFASPINKLFTIIKGFLKIIFLPILLVFAFLVPFLMLFTAPWQVSIAPCDINRFYKTFVYCCIHLQYRSTTN